MKNLKVWFLASFMMSSVLLKATTNSVFITEVMNVNLEQFLSPAFNFDGWVELYNDSYKPISLDGIEVFVPKKSTKKWIAPSKMGAIGAKDYYILWFDSNDLSPIHVPFSLDEDGGSLCMVLPQSGDTISVEYPHAIARTSYAMADDGRWGYTSDPTPGYKNCGAFSDVQLPKPESTITSCVFEKPFSIDVAHDDDVDVYYTLDGTIPTLSNGYKLDGSILVDKTTSIRFRSFKSGMLPSDVSTYSYIQRKYDFGIPIVSVITDSRYLYDDSIGVMVKGVNGKPGNGRIDSCNWNMNWDRPVFFTYYDKEGYELFHQDVNLEMCGGNSRAVEPHSFKLKANKKYGQGKRLKYPFFTAKPTIKNKTLQLRNGGNDYQCRIKDAAIATIVQRSGIDIELQCYQPIAHYINGEYKGLLNMREPNNKHYVYANYCWDEDEIDLFEMEPSIGYVQKCGTDSAFRRLYDLSFHVNEQSSYEEIEKLLDVEAFAKYVAVSLYLGRTRDWPRNNVKGFRHKDNGRFRFVQYDTDAAFLDEEPEGEGKEGPFFYLTDRQYYWFSGIKKEVELVTIILNMFQKEDFLRQVIDMACIYGGSVFTPTLCSSIIDELANITAPVLQIENLSPWETAAALKESFDGRMDKFIQYAKSFNMANLSQEPVSSISIKTENELGGLQINGIDVPYSCFDGKIIGRYRLKIIVPEGYKFDGWYDVVSNKLVSTQEELEMEIGNVSLVAKIEPIGLTPIKDVKENNLFAIYKDDSIILKSDVNYLEIAIISVNGEIVKKGKVALLSGEGSVKTNDIPKGIYILVVNDSKGNLHTNKILIE